MVETINKLGTWGGVFGRRSKTVKEIAEDLRSLIIGLHPDVTITPRNGDKAVSFGFGQKKMSECYCYLMPQKDRVNLGLYWGTMLSDPNGLMEGTGKKLRHVKIFDQQTARSAKVAQLLHSAISERKLALENAIKAKAAEKTSGKKNKKNGKELA